VAIFAKRLRELGVVALVFDPVYMSLGDVDARSVFETGTALKAVGNVMLSAGVTPIFVHHANGRLQTGEVMELSHLRYTGFEQYVRQWLLLNRHTPYRGDGTHDLFVNIAGSIGHSKLLVS
jgi:hypothetical protein